MTDARWNVYVCCSYWTWAQSGASYFLDALSLAEGAAIERGRVGAGPRALLEASPTAAVTHRPLCPGGPASIHCKVREKEHGHTSSPAWAAPRRFQLCVMQPQTVATRDGMRNIQQAQTHVSNTPSVCQKSLYKLKKCWCWMKNTPWWLSGLAGDLPYPENQPDPAKTNPTKIPAGSESSRSQKPVLWKLHCFPEGDNLHSHSCSDAPITHVHWETPHVISYKEFSFSFFQESNVKMSGWINESFQDVRTTSLTPLCGHSWCIYKCPSSSLRCSEWASTKCISFCFGILGRYLSLGRYLCWLSISPTLVSGIDGGMKKELCCST